MTLFDFRHDTGRVDGSAVSDTVWYYLRDVFYIASKFIDLYVACLLNWKLFILLLAH